MKNLILLSLTLLTSKAVFANNSVNVEKIKMQSLINVHNLECMVQAGIQSNLTLEERLMTRLPKVFVIGDRQNAIEVDHNAAVAKGCDLTLLDEMIQESHTRFGHLSANVTLTKETQVTPRLINGKCVHMIIESLELDFGRGLVLNTPRRSVMKETTGCN